MLRTRQKNDYALSGARRTTSRESVARTGPEGRVDFSTISPMQAGKLETLIKEKCPPFKLGHRVLENLNLKMLVTDDGFEAKLSLINPSNKSLIYFEVQVNDSIVSMLINI